MEDLDHKIIDQLTADGRMSFTDLGHAVGMSTSAAHQRVRRLERQGVITGYTARVDHAAIGAALTAYMWITALEPEAAPEVPAALRAIAAVEECHSVAGADDFLLKVRVSSPAELEDLAVRIRSAARVSSRTTLVLSTPWE